jgi:hypothetical protein
MATLKVIDLVVWDGKQPGTYNYWRTMTLMDLNELGCTHVLTAEKIYQLNDDGSIPADFADPNPAKPLKDDDYASYILALLKVHKKKIEELTNKAYAHILKTLTPSIAQDLMDSEPNSASAFMRALDRRYLKLDYNNIIQYIIEYINFSINEDDDILAEINTLNHLTQVLNAAKFPDFVDRRVRGGLLIKRLSAS